MNERNLKPWPHSPGIIAGHEIFMRVVEEYGRPVTVPATAEDADHVVKGYLARIFGREEFFSTYELAAKWCAAQKHLRAWREKYVKPAAPFPHFYSLADELGV